MLAVVGVGPLTFSTTACTCPPGTALPDGAGANVGIGVGVVPGNIGMAVGSGAGFAPEEPAVVIVHGTWTRSSVAPPGPLPRAAIAEFGPPPGSSEPWAPPP